MKKALVEETRYSNEKRGQDKFENAHWDDRASTNYNVCISLSPLQTASPARKGRKGKTPPAEVETAEAEKKEEEAVKEKEEEAKVEKKKGGRKAKSAPAIIETTKEVEVKP